MASLAARRATDRAVKAISTGFAVFALFLLGWILWTLLSRGLPALGLNVFTQVTKPPGQGGGLLNAIVGSLIQIGIAMAIGGPIGIFCGTFLAENGKGTKVGAAARFVNDILLSAPSILVGLFIYTLLVVPLGGFSGWAGSIALAILVIPVIVRTTEDMLNLVPVGLREAAFALGAPQWKVVMFITWRAARAGIVTGVLLAIARAAGETAPLLFTSLGNNAMSTDLSKPMASLPIAIYQFAGSPFDDWVSLAWAGALLITVGVLVLNVASRLFLARSH
ncbi:MULTISPECIES: phosphate ABC transporter permease PstA [Xanthobacter]|jgi:phosphate transport system permease protein|uniref:Phosphate transport system permease protein PstA n=1 Tax=Xanthobacter aminoxidans TaxID=186280 RepID=A0ABW6ZIL4_9HYPH|nr:MULTISPECIES: phosphate ABC transporter permease PstA [Xanthobacter]MCL8384421.1 phosphate ABC transporter permease PstA [Xanthobacter aminoxidans]